MTGKDDFIRSSAEGSDRLDGYAYIICREF